MAIEYKLSYTASDINRRLGKIDSLAEKSELPTKMSELVNDSGYLTEHQSLDGLATEEYVSEQIAAIPTPDVSGQIETHNTATDSHNDIRLLIDGLTTRLNTLADSDDTTLDQMSEVVAYIKSNKSLIDSITTNKVSVADIIDNLTTNVSDKPLSAAQGVALKALIDAIVVPTKVSELTNDAGYLTEHQDLSSYALKSEVPSIEGLATEEFVRDGFQPKGSYLTEVPEGYATEEFVQNKIAEAELGGEEVDLSGYAQKSELPTKVSQLENDKGYLTSYTETDPTVPDWAKAETKPVYTAKEVGAAEIEHTHDNYALKTDILSLDTTLSIEGKAADAKAVGDAISQLSGTSADYVVQDTAPEDTSVLWVDTSDNSDGGFQEAVNVALAQAKESGEFDGADGDNGVSCTHSWNGTTLTVTSASGTSSADLKGADGYTPVKGTDYYTEADKTEIVNTVLEQIPESEGGIAITGATVGQTVKISAVNDNGVPTAWEPVDFPDSGVNAGLPEVTVDDAGKFLCVSSDGEWVAKTVDSAEGVSF